MSLLGITTSVLVNLSIVLALLLHCCEGRHYRRVLLDDVTRLSLNSATQIVRYNQVVSQMICVAGPEAHRPSVMHCEREAPDCEWVCDANLHPNYRLGVVRIVCEGYDSPEDRYVVEGSCGAAYTYMYHPPPPGDYGVIDYVRDAVLLILCVLAVVAFALSPGV